VSEPHDRSRTDPTPRTGDLGAHQTNRRSRSAGGRAAAGPVREWQRRDAAPVPQPYLTGGSARIRRSTPPVRRHRVRCRVGVSHRAWTPPGSATRIERQLGHGLAHRRLYEITCECHPLPDAGTAADRLPPGSRSIDDARSPTVPAITSVRNHTACPLAIARPQNHRNPYHAGASGSTHRRRGRGTTRIPGFVASLLRVVSSPWMNASRQRVGAESGRSAPAGVASRFWASMTFTTDASLPTSRRPGRAAR